MGKCADIVIVQGDDKHIKVSFSGTGASSIASFYFSSATLELKKHITEQESNEWYVHLTDTETTAFSAGNHTFDITAITTSSDVITGLYHGTICVKEKDNVYV